MAEWRSWKMELIFHGRLWRKEERRKPKTSLMTQQLISLLSPQLLFSCWWKMLARSLPSFLSSSPVTTPISLFLSFLLFSLPQLILSRERMKWCVARIEFLDPRQGSPFVSGNSSRHATTILPSDDEHSPSTFCALSHWYICERGEDGKEEERCNTYKNREKEREGDTSYVMREYQWEVISCHHSFTHSFISRFSWKRRNRRKERERRTRQETEKDKGRGTFGKRKRGKIIISVSFLSSLFSSFFIL